MTWISARIGMLVTPAAFITTYRDADRVCGASDQTGAPVPASLIATRASRSGSRASRQLDDLRALSLGQQVPQLVAVFVRTLDVGVDLLDRSHVTTQRSAPATNSSERTAQPHPLDRSFQTDARAKARTS